MLHICHSSLDPAFNLALEETLFCQTGRNYFWLWQNSPAIIIGAHQDMATEVDVAAARARGIRLVRRISGGGAVYHDAGNLNFSFIEDAPFSLRHSLQFGRYLRPVCRALAALGLDAHVTGRNDITCNGLKISGCSQLLRRGRILCHGTLLVAVNMEAVCACLKPASAKRKAHRVASASQRIGNLADMWGPGNNMARLKTALARACLGELTDQRASPLPASLLSQAQILAEKKYLTREWNFGAGAPWEYSRRRRFDFGEVILEWRGGSSGIAACRLTGDFFGSRESGELAEIIAHAPQGQICRALQSVDLREFFNGCDPDEVSAWLEECLCSPHFPGSHFPPRHHSCPSRQSKMV